MDEQLQSLTRRFRPGIFQPFEKRLVPILVGQNLTESRKLTGVLIIVLPLPSNLDDRFISLQTVLVWLPVAGQVFIPPRPKFFCCIL